MKYYVIAGEASGDLHASNLLMNLKKFDDAANFRAWGGDLMEQKGATIVKHYNDLAFMGFTEVLMNLKTILNNIKFCKKDILAYQPDVLILVDYPGFNLRIAEWAKEQGIKVFYYISPQVWAWKQSRVHKIKKFVDKMFVILPFEEGFYNKFDYKVDFVGHPLLDAIKNRNKLPIEEFRKINKLSDKPIIALLPGSRKQEVSTMLPIMLSVTSAYKDYEFVIAKAPGLNDEFYKPFIAASNIKLVRGKTYDLLEHAYAALVTSGTATLETALFNVPQVVCYKGGTISYQIAKKLVKINYISLVNLIVDKEIVKELIQTELNTKNIQKELDKLLDKTYRNNLFTEYKNLRNVLGGEGASERTAQLMLSYLSS